MFKKKSLIAVGSLLLVVQTSLFSVEFIVKDANVEDGKDATWIALPYLFSSDSMGLTTGIVGIFNGFIQPQMTIVASAFIGEELDVTERVASGENTDAKARSKGFFLGVTGFKPSFSERMFLTLLASYTYYPNQRLYIDGSNDSVRDIDSTNESYLAPFETQGYKNWADLDFRFVLPLGEGKHTVTPTIKLSRGLAVNRDDKGNGAPFVTGQTLIGVNYFYSKLTADKLTEDPSLNSNGLKLYFEHDNTDYPDNPTRGYNIKAKVAADFGWANSSQSWNSLDAGYSHYLEIPNFSWTRQNVIAFNAWTAYSPSWKKGVVSKENPYIEKNRPPMWEGPTLGGYNRMRAYDMNRFSDKAAIYGAVEYRIIPEFNPMHNQEWSPIPIDWFQAVVFAEVGRVAPKYNLDLFSDMKYDVGFSIRALAARLPVRFEMAFGEEGSSMWVMIKQPF